MAASALLLLAACRPGSDEAANRDGQAAPDTGAAVGMPGMPGMGGMQSSEMITEMMGHMNRMQRMSGDSLKAMMPSHRQMAANMLAQMNREMQSMNMTGDSAWTATLDSVRADLTRMPELSPAELQALMPDHQRRMMRLMEAHQAMMRNRRM
ncbi:MAG: hypothetical protein ACRENP_02555 [Longimicrobiales bacterium]